jgi:hypothetical protein
MPGSKSSAGPVGEPSTTTEKRVGVNSGFVAEDFATGFVAGTAADFAVWPSAETGKMAGEIDRLNRAMSREVRRIVQRRDGIAESPKPRLRDVFECIQREGFASSGAG